MILDRVALVVAFALLFLLTVLGVSELAGLVSDDPSAPVTRISAPVYQHPEEYRP